MSLVFLAVTIAFIVIGIKATCETWETVRKWEDLVEAGHRFDDHGRCVCGEVRKEMARAGR